MTAVADSLRETEKPGILQRLGGQGLFNTVIVGSITAYLLISLGLPLYSIITRSFRSKDGVFIGLDNYAAYFSNSARIGSIYNSTIVATITMLATVTLAFGFAYALHYSRMPFKGLMRAMAMVPLLVPSLLPGISLIYLFGKQGVLTPLLFGHSIYGPIGIVIASVFFTFPYAFIILSTAMSLADQRLYEAAISLKGSRWRVFWTVTIPGVRYGLISALIVVFVMTFTDFGVPKVIGGSFNVLPVDIYKQVIGQQNFEMGAVVSTVVLLPVVLAFFVDMRARNKQKATLTANSVPYHPEKNRRFDMAMFAYCSAISAFMLTIILTSQFAALVKFWPYNLSLSLQNYDFNTSEGGGWGSFTNTIRLATLTAVIGTIVIFFGSYVVEKGKGLRVLREVLQFFAMMPMAIPGTVLGLSYIFFFNNPSNPLNPLYGTMAILVICTLTHFYTVVHITMTTALKQLDPEFESVSSSLRQPTFRMVRSVTIPITMPTILNVWIYLFVSATTTVSAVVFIYSPDTVLASVSMVNMNDAGDNAPAAAMGMMIFYLNLAVRILHGFVSKLILSRTQVWRKR